MTLTIITIDLVVFIPTIKLTYLLKIHINMPIYLFLLVRGQTLHIQKTEFLVGVILFIFEKWLWM